MKYRLTTFLILFSLAVLPQTVLAVGTLQNATGQLTNTGRQAGTEETDDLGAIVGTVINVALSLIGVIFLILMVYAGYLWMTARGEDEQVNKARKIIINSLIGVVIVISAYAITYLVTSRFTG